MNNETSNKEITIKIPIALEEMIISNNELLKNYQAKLMKKIQEANIEMMGILQLSPSAGWKLDMGRMVYTRPVNDNEIVEN